MNIFTQRLRQTLAVAVMAGCAFGAKAKIEQVRFAVDPTYPPFESKTPQGKLVGFDIDLGNALLPRCRRNASGLKASLTA